MDAMIAFFIIYIPQICIALAAGTNAEHPLAAKTLLTGATGAIQDAAVRQPKQAGLTRLYKRVNYKNNEMKETCMLSLKSILELAEVNETGVDEQERHVFTDSDLAEFAKQVLAAGTVRLLNALDCMDHGCREPGFQGHENGLGDEKAGNELQSARDELADYVGHQAVPEPFLF